MSFTDCRSRNNVHPRTAGIASSSPRITRKVAVDTTNAHTAVLTS
jgi:hypothetical protein